MKLFLFNPRSSKDFLPKFSINYNDIEMVEEENLVGVIVVIWSSNMDYITKKGNKKRWMLMRLRKIYIKQIRSILEFAVPVWHSSLIGVDRLKIERVQKTALHIILGDRYRSYNSALRCLNWKLCSLEDKSNAKTLPRKVIRTPNSKIGSS